MKTLKTVLFGGRKFAVASPDNREQPKEEVPIYNKINVSAFFASCKTQIPVKYCCV